MNKITLYSTTFCGWCDEAKDYLNSRGIAYEEINVSRDTAARAEVLRVSGQEYVPTIVVDGKVLANFDVEQLQEFLEEIEAATHAKSQAPNSKSQ